MSRTGATLLSALAVFAVGTTASASASAQRFIGHSCTKLSGAGVKFKSESECLKQEGVGSGEWEHVELTNGTKAVGTIGVSKLKGEILSKEVIITCSKGTLTAEFEKGGASKGKAVFEECKIGNSKETFTGCGVLNISISSAGQLVGSPVEDELKPKSGAKDLAEIAVEPAGEASCADTGVYPLEGTQKCKLPSGETLKVEHEINCTPAGSSLEFNGKKGATFEGIEKVKLESKAEWAGE
jgi:hypothetical protein